MDGGTNCTWKGQPPVAHIAALFTLGKKLSSREEANHGHTAGGILCGLDFVPPSAGCLFAVSNLARTTVVTLNAEVGSGRSDSMSLKICLETHVCSLDFTLAVRENSYAG